MSWDYLTGHPHIVRPYSYRYTRPERIQAFLDSARAELKAYFGDYEYRLIQIWCGPKRYSYEIRACYYHNGWRHFVDGRGKSPWAALMSMNCMKDFLRTLGVLAPLGSE